MDNTNYLIDRVLSVSRIELDDNALTWVAKSIENPQLEFTGETTEKRDAAGTLIASFDTAKGATMSGELSLLNMAVLASQLGTEVEFASNSNKILVDFIDEVEVGTGGVCKLTKAPKTAPTQVFALKADGSLGTSYTIGTDTGNATYTAASGDNAATITLPTGYTCTKVALYYQYESATAVMVDDGSENFTSPAKYVMKILAADICNPALKRSGFVVFPKAKIDNNLSLTLTTEGTQPFSLTALKDYCDDSARLCYILWDE